MTATSPLRDTFPPEEDGGEPTLPRKRYDYAEEIDRFEVARRLDVAPSTVQQWILRTKANELPVPFPPGRKVGRKLLWTWGSIVGWHNARLKAVGAGPLAQISRAQEATRSRADADREERQAQADRLQAALVALGFEVTASAGRVGVDLTIHDDADRLTGLLRWMAES